MRPARPPRRHESYRGGMEGLTGSRRRTLEALRGAAAPLTLAGLAALTGSPANTLRDHLASLVAEGLVADAPPIVAGRGRPARRFVATRGPRREAMDVLTALAAEVGARPDAAEAALAAGRRWASGLAPCPGEESLRCAAALLAELGFAPHRVEGALVLRACPVRAAADTTPEVICAMHLGLLEQVLPGAAVSLERRPADQGCILTVGHG